MDIPAKSCLVALPRESNSATSELNDATFCESHATQKAILDLQALAAKVLERHKSTLSKKTQLSKLLEPHAEELVNKAVELAKQGEPIALRLCLDKLRAEAEKAFKRDPLPPLDP
jgi:hypothetical protein